MKSRRSCLLVLLASLLVAVLSFAGWFSLATLTFWETQTVDWIVAVDGQRALVGRVDRERR